MPTVASHQSVRLARGRHGDPDTGVCVMELASMLAGERFSDHPQCVCRVIASVLRSCNDRFNATDRQRLYPCAADAVGTRAEGSVERRRLEACAAAVKPHAWMRRWRRTPELRPPAGTSDLEIERFTDRVVRVVHTRSARPVDELLALVDELLAIGRPGSGAPEIGAGAPLVTLVPEAVRR